MAYEELRKAYSDLVTSTNLEEVKEKYGEFFEITERFVKKGSRLERIYLSARKGDKKNLLILLRKVRRVICWTGGDEVKTRFYRNILSGKIDDEPLEGIGLTGEVLEHMRKTSDIRSEY